MPPEWRYLPEVPGYGISADGHVLGPRGRVLQQNADHKGYPRIRARNALGVKKNWKVHRLVALAWVGPAPSPKHVVRHLDGNPTNNCHTNLAWGTYQDNLQDAIDHGTWRVPSSLTDWSGAELYNATFTWDDVVAIRSAYEAGGVTQTKLAKDWGASVQVIHDVVRYKTYRRIPV